MKKIYILLSILALHACNEKRSLSSKQLTDNISSPSVTENYELIKTHQKAKGLLILFGGYPETPSDIKREFNILKLAEENGIDILLMKFNQRLWLEKSEKQQLTITLKKAIEKHQLVRTNIFMGGFSSGGNIALLLGNHLIKHTSNILPKGIFVVDSPVDLLQLYHCSKRNIERNFSPVSMQESQRTIHSFDTYFGQADEGIEKYEQYSPYISQTENLSNLSALKDTKLRLYTEPDTTWWKANRQNEYKDLNACYIKKLAHQLEKQLGNQNVALIETENKGYRSNGYRHPHSWSIVDKKGLFDWMLSK